MYACIPVCSASYAAFGRMFRSKNCMMFLLLCCRPDDKKQLNFKIMPKVRSECGECEEGHLAETELTSKSLWLSISIHFCCIFSDSVF